MRRRNAAAVSAAAMAALAAVAGPASAQDQAQGQAPAGDGQGSATTTPGPASTTPAPATPAPAADPAAPTDLGTLEVQVDKLPPAAKKSPRSADQQRRADARRFLKDAKKNDRDAAEKATDEPVADPFGNLPSPLLAPPVTGVPNVVIDSLRIPPFLLPIYQAAGVEYGVRWEVLAAINEIETDYGRNLSVSTAGAVGWMQFMPATWAAYGVDGNADGRKDPYNPVDAIFAAARYLRAAGADSDLRRAIFAYNHADWYVNDVIGRAQALASLPPDVVGALTGLTLGRFPIDGEATYPGAYAAADKQQGDDNASVAIAGTKGRTGIDIAAADGAAVIAAQDGRVVGIGTNERLGKFVQVRDAYGNTYTYGHLESLSDVHVVPRNEPTPSQQAASTTAPEPESDPAPRTAATAGSQGKPAANTASAPDASATAAARPKAVKERLFANPQRPNAFTAGGQRQLTDAPDPSEQQPVADGALGQYLARPYALRRNQVALQPLRKGSRVIAGTILGRVGQSSLRWGKATHARFEIRPSGASAPRIDPTPILDGWRLLESTHLFRAQKAGRGTNASIGQVLLMGKEALERRVLANPDITIYECGRRDIQAGIIDRRVLATLEFLAASGLKPTVTSLRCDHGYYTAGGNVSEHSSGDAMDIAAINGTPIIGHQGEGSITDIAVRALLTLQGSMKPHQLITLMQYAGTDNTYAMGDHDDHIHVGFRPLYGDNTKAGKATAAVLQPGQWSRLIGRLSAIQNPAVPLKPSRYAVKVKLKVKQR